MKNLIALLVVMISFSGFSQKVKLKKEEVLIDDVVWLKYDGCTAFKYQLCSLYNLKGEEIIFFKFIQKSSDHTIYNKYGDPNYYEVSFLGLNKKIEIRERIDNFIKVLYNSKVVNEDGTLNIDQVDRIVEKYGSSYSKINQNNTQTIIIKEETPRSGININLGR